MTHQDARDRINLMICRYCPQAPRGCPSCWIGWELEHGEQWPGFRKAAERRCSTCRLWIAGFYCRAMSTETRHGDGTTCKGWEPRWPRYVRPVPGTENIDYAPREET